jgi:hypothetical protein
MHNAGKSVILTRAHACTGSFNQRQQANSCYCQRGGKQVANFGAYFDSQFVSNWSQPQSSGAVVTDKLK